MQMRAGVDADGQAHWRGTGAASAAAASTARRRQRRGAQLLHRAPRSAARRNSHKDLATDTDPARPMRAPGTRRASSAPSCSSTSWPRKAGIDPLEFRLANDQSAMRQDQWRSAPSGSAGRPLARARQNATRQPWLRGVGLASARWGQLGPAADAHGITCRIHQDGTVESRSGAQDIGTGLKTVMAMITAEELGIDRVASRRPPATRSTPSGPASGGSTTTPSLAPAVRHAAFLAKATTLIARVAKAPRRRRGHVRCEGGKVASTASAALADACKLIGPEPDRSARPALPQLRRTRSSRTSAAASSPRSRSTRGPASCA
jgi:CO/xanthine dehydrogenase Mo-binding subunit